MYSISDCDFGTANYTSKRENKMFLQRLNIYIFVLQNSKRTFVFLELLAAPPFPLCIILWDNSVYWQPFRNQVVLFSTVYSILNSTKVYTELLSLATIWLVQSVWSHTLSRSHILWLFASGINKGVLRGVASLLILASWLWAP